MKKSNYIKLIFIAIIFISICCNRNGVKTQNFDSKFKYDPKNLLIYYDDIEIQDQLRFDTLYLEIEELLVSEDSLTLQQAEQQVQTMIDEKLIPEPSLTFVSGPRRNSYVVDYKTFKKYMMILKDSLRKQGYGSP